MTPVTLNFKDTPLSQAIEDLRSIYGINFFIDHGALRTASGGEFEIDYSRIRDAVRDLDHELLTVEAHGDFDGATKLLELATLRSEVRAVLDRLADLPTDIEPVFVTASCTC